ncbi:MAG: ketopantoate reductase family protein [Janthinobacterium lividum]
MKFAIMGAGAVGCFYGGMLARAGHEVVLIGRPAHVAAIARDGLRLETTAFDERIALTASVDPAAVRGAACVLFCVKSTDTASAAAAIAPHLASDTVLFSLQNGVENAAHLRALLPQDVAAAVVYVAAEMAGPGHVRHRGRGELIVAPSRRSDALARACAAAGVPTEISGNVRGALWAKLTINCAYNALSAIAKLPYGRLVAGAGVQDAIDGIVAECLAVARAEGVEVVGDVPAAVRRIIDTMPLQYSSTAQDLARGRRTEIDHLNGLIARRGQALNIPTPLNSLLHTLVKLLESAQGDRDHGSAQTQREDGQAQR